MRTPTPLKIAIFHSGRPQREIADALGIHEATLSRIVNGLRADPHIQARIAEVLGRPVADLFPADEARAA